jgi:hypothetical protein
MDGLDVAPCGIQSPRAGLSPLVDVHLAGPFGAEDLARAAVDRLRVDHPSAYVSIVRCFIAPETGRADADLAQHRARFGGPSSCQ